MATPTSRTRHLLPLLLLLSAASIHVSTTDEEQLPITHPHCQDKCGNISIPYPFGINAGCFHQGFEVICNGSYDLPRLFLAADKPISGDFLISRNPYMMISHFHYSSTESKPHKINESLLPVEIMDISVSEGQVRIHGAFSLDCRENETYHTSRIQGVYLPGKTPFLLSEEKNVLLVIGRKVEALMPLGCGGNLQVRTAGRCLGKGWCMADIHVDMRASYMHIMRGYGVNDTEWRTSPCSYGMVVEDSWYRFSPQDLDSNSFLQRNQEGGVPVVLHFTITGVECPMEGEPLPNGYTCKSKNSECLDGPVPPSHYCTCSKGFQGNPYIDHGCQDIDECKRPDLYPCHGKCKNKQGDYECTCPPGTRGDAKAGPCTDIFPLAAKASLGAMGGVFFMAILAFPILLHREKRRMRDFFEKNGGPTLEKAKNIKIYKKEELKGILKSNNFVGKGGFGEVYKGLLDNDLVAVKKPIDSNNMAHNEQFANEVIIQSQVSHKNIVRLKGCCLEVDIPMLVYEFLPNGSLHDILHDDSNKMPLDLDRRLNIAAGSADGLAYMHSKVSDKILHGDVKPANILLDENLVPKISDFGISRLILRDKQHTGWIIGDLSYMDPIYLQSGLLTEKSDVYSFGVVLLELISRKKATHAGKNNLVSDFVEARNKKDKKQIELFDTEIAKESNLDDLNTVAGIAVECLNLDVDQRPVMTYVAERLLMLQRSRGDRMKTDLPKVGASCTTEKNSNKHAVE